MAARSAGCARFTGAEEGDTLRRTISYQRSRHVIAPQYQQNASRRPDGRGANNDRLRQLRPHAGDHRRPRQGRGLRRQSTCRSIRRRFSTAPSNSRSSTSPSFRSRATSAGRRRHLGYIGIPAFVSRIFRHSGIYIRTDAGIKHAGGPARQAHRPAGIPDHRRGLDARHAAARIRREAERYPLRQWISFGDTPYSCCSIPRIQTTAVI